jgi:F-type H+-transporting ATPase subunit b
MLIDWFTVAAQTVNFLLLIWLLKRFLYGPIIGAMERRETRIENRLQEARQEQETARAEVAEYQRLNQELEESRADSLRQAGEEAAQHRQQLIDQGRAEASALAEAWKAAVCRDRQLFMAELKKRIGSEVLQITRKSLNDLTGSDLTTLLVERFIARFAALEDEQQETCRAAAEKSGVMVRSAGTLDQAIRGDLETELRRVLGPDLEISYRSEEEMPLGIELVLGGLKLSWGVDSYFAELERQIDLQLEEVSAVAEDPGRNR